MLADRDYIKNRNLPNRKSYSLVQWTTFLCVACFIVDALMGGGLRRTFLLNREDLLKGELWRLFTSFFMTQGNNPLSFVFDLFIFYFMGRDLESIYNPQTLKSYYKFGLLGAVVGILIALSLSLRLDLALFSCLMSMVWVGFGISHFARKMTFQIFFVIPVVVTGKILLLLMLGYFSYIAFVGHWILILPACGAALGMFLGMEKSKPKKTVKTLKKNEPHKLKKSIRKNELQEGFQVHSSEYLAKNSMDPEVDEVLDKILESGIDSLTPKERETLESVNKDN